MLRTSILALALTFFAQAALAQGVLYDCDITQKRKDLDWISDKVGIVVKANGQVTVIDAVILYFHQKPMQAKVVRNTKDKLDIRWTIRNAKDDANQRVPYFDYSATINKKNNKFALYARPENYPNRFSGKGKCTPRTQ
ncbi:hypothetical protein KX928_08010 [Roseobacter sp. YSTF-M11]|uniref:Uncharacterized protein n=1 Tax=Roseobacter insulae TaxID=2859783 RepID=A0A9X1K012_9RHOB|nr:hypothetical protein [Roseobacter insulae]MBW4707729.1 hypothetical protein [Roseobacter insulae]